MKKKSILAILFMVLILLLVLQGCTPSGDTNTTEEKAPVTPTAVPADTAIPETNETTMTPEELSHYNGQNGNPAYIAVDGVIYDVSSVSPWNGGNHNGFTAGQDLTEEIKTISPHGVSKLNGLPVIGTLTD